MPIQDDVSIALNGDIRWAGAAASTVTYTVLELHRFLQDLADNETIGAGAFADDLVDITSRNPSIRSTDNIISLVDNSGSGGPRYNIDEAMSHHLYDGSISQTGVDGFEELYGGLIVVGSVPAGTELQVVQNNTLLTAFWVGDDSPAFGPAPNQANASGATLMQCVVLVRDGPSGDIDGGRLRVQARELGDTYAEFTVTLGQGNSTAAIFTATDLNNASAEGTISGWVTIVNASQGYVGLDVDNDTSDEFYYSSWTRGTQSINDLYERAKWLTRRGTGETLYGLNGALFRGITHQIDYDGEASGPFVEQEVLTFSNGATAQLLAIRDDGVTGRIWVQLLTGETPDDNATISGGTSAATAVVNGSPVGRSVSAPFIGQSTGSSLIGGYGVGVSPTDLTNNDQLFDLGNAPVNPPNFVTFIVAGLSDSEDDDYVLVGPRTAGQLDVSQLQVATSSVSAASTAVVVGGAIPLDTPTSGTIRLERDLDNTYVRLEYTSYSGSTFTLGGGTPTAGVDAAIGNNVFISYIDSLAVGTSAQFVTVYQSDRDLFVRVRDGGSTPVVGFESPATLTSAGGSLTAILQSDL